MTENQKEYVVYLGAGCHGEQYDPEVSRHDTLLEAKLLCIGNDRLYTIDDQQNKFTTWRVSHLGADGERIRQQYGEGRKGASMTLNEARDAGLDI